MSRLVREIVEKQQKTGEQTVLNVKLVCFQDPEMFEVFRKYLDDYYAIENLEFLEACWRGDSYESIAETFIMKGARKEVNVPAQGREAFLAAMPEAWQRIHIPAVDPETNHIALPEPEDPKERDVDLMGGSTDSSADEDDTYQVQELANADAEELKFWTLELSREVQTIIDRNFMVRFSDSLEFTDYCFRALGGQDSMGAMMLPLMSSPDPDRPKDPEKDKKRGRWFVAAIQKIYVDLMLGAPKEECERVVNEVKARMAPPKDVPTDEYLEKVKKSIDKKVKALFQKQDQDKEDQRPMRVAKTEEEFLAGYEKLEDAYAMTLAAGNRKKATAILNLISDFATANEKLAAASGKFSGEKLATASGKFSNESKPSGKTVEKVLGTAVKRALETIADKQSDRHFDALTNPEAEADDIPPPPPDDDMPPPPPEDADDDDDVPPPPPLDDTADDSDHSFDQTEELMDADDIPPPPLSDGPPPLPPRPTDQPAAQEQAADQPPFAMPPSRNNNKIIEAIQESLLAGDVAEATGIAERTVALFKEKGWVHANTTTEDVLDFAKGAMKINAPSRDDTGTSNTTEEEDEKLAKYLLKKFKMEKFRQHYVSNIAQKHVVLFDTEFHALVERLIKQKGKIAKLIPKTKVFMAWAKSMKIKMKIDNHKHLIGLIVLHLKQIQKEGSLKAKVQKADALEIWKDDES